MATPVQEFSPLKTRGMRSGLQTPLSNHNRQSQGDLIYYLSVNNLFYIRFFCLCSYTMAHISPSQLKLNNCFYGSMLNEFMCLFCIFCFFYLSYVSNIKKRLLVFLLFALSKLLIRNPGSSSMQRR